MISNVLLVVGAAFLSAALRTYRHPVLFRLGTFGMVGTSFLAGWLIAGSVTVGVAFVAIWFLLPWVEILTRARRMRVPLKRILEPVAPPARAAFPELAELSGDLEEAGFVHADDVAWEHAETRHFFRLFTNPVTRAHAAICLVEQSGFSLPYLMVLSRTESGRVLMTWNYAYSYGLRLPPNLVVRRVGADESVADLLKAHQELQATAAPETLRSAEPTCAKEEMETELREQLEHNLACGLLLRDGPELIRYSARGMFFLWTQFLRDFVRLS